MPSAINGYLEFLAALPHHHSVLDALYPSLKAAAQKDWNAVFGEAGPQVAVLAHVGTIKLPYFKMGAIDSVNLFDLDELILFAFYCLNFQRYRQVVDIGANIGLHSLILAALGCRVTCYEPDPVHMERLLSNLELNGLSHRVKAIQAAVSGESGEREFVRVLGNTTGSHLAGAKANPYGELERFSVKLVAFRSIVEGADLVKIDAEGAEAGMLTTTKPADWERMDALVEVGNPQNAEAIFCHFRKLGVNLFSQKAGWLRITELSDMPTHYTEGSLFISARSSMPWQLDETQHDYK